MPKSQQPILSRSALSRSVLSRPIQIVLIMGLTISLLHLPPFCLLNAGSAAAQSATQTAPVDYFNAVGTLWLVIAALLVFFMNAGFAMLETGFCRTGNAVNVLAKNLIVFCITAIAFGSLVFATCLETAIV